tara:strand:- start:1216 stop:1866 length:651 start_codon:yes stop_codon:yes gene_type:complete
MNEEQIKTRLVGSIVVVLAVVILVPIFLENKEGQQEKPTIQELPPRISQSQEELLDWDGSTESLKSRIDSVFESPKSIDSVQRNDRVGDESISENDLPDVRQAKKPTLDFDDSLDKLEATIENQLRQRAKSEGNSELLMNWVVQVGSFSSEDNANLLIKKLSQQSFSAFVIERDENDGASFRVRVGPFDEKSEAMKVLSIIEEKFGLVGFLVKIRP